jgi:signal transduction histidine kinase
MMERGRLREALLGHGVALGATAAIVGAWLAIPAGWGEHIPFSMFLLSVGAASLVGGFWPGMLAVALGAAMAVYVGTPRFVWALHAPADWILFAIFAVNGPLVALVCARLRQTLRVLRLAIAEIERVARVKESGLEEQIRHADRLSTVGKLAAGVAHELGTPLAVVSGRAKRIVRSGPPAETGDDARIIVEQADRMAAIIRQLLDFARRRGAVKAPADVGALARSTIGLLAPFAAKRGVMLRVDDASDATPIAVDAGQLQQALTNLIMNGVQAMSRGGELRVAIERARLTPPAAVGGAEASYLVLRVVDQGVGIQPEHVAHVFEPFFTTKDVGEGTGLGLSVAHGIVAEHGGWIDVASEPGAGATFTVHLPAGAEVRM